MQCPVCKNVDLVMSSRQDIEIDYCPTCRGVWLDRGELDKIIDRSQRESGPAIIAPPHNERPVSEREERDGHHGASRRGKHGRGSFLERLFD